MKNEEKLKPIVSYSEQHDMPLLPTTTAIDMAIGILNDPTKVKDATFEPDEKFINWWKKEHDTEPTQSEINNYVAEVIGECREASEAEVRLAGHEKKVDD